MCYVRSNKEFVQLLIKKSEIKAFVTAQLFLVTTQTFTDINVEPIHNLVRSNSLCR